MFNKFKRTLLWTVAAGAVITLGHASASAQEAKLKLFTENYPPFNYEDPANKGTVTGWATDILVEVMKRANVQYDIELLPWKRAYEGALNEPNTCVYTAALTDERKPLFKWVAPVLPNDWVLFAHKDADIKVSSLEDAKKYKIGSYNGDAKADFLKAQGIQPDIAPNDELNPRKLESKRIDLWIASANTAPILAKEQGVAIKPVFTVREGVLGLACNKGLPDAVVDKLNAELQAVVKSGLPDKLKAKYQ